MAQKADFEWLALNYRRRYLAALVLIGMLVTASWALLQGVASQGEANALLVNVSGRQRMLSQRTALFAQQYVDGGRSDAALRERLLGAMELLERSHEQLSRGDPANGFPVAHSDAIEHAYFSPGQGVDGLLRRYLNSLRTLLDPATDGALVVSERDRAVALAQGPLLDRLNAVVEIRQREGEAFVQRLQRIETGIWLSALLVLLLVARFIFRPLAVLLRNTLAVAGEGREHMTELAQLSSDWFFEVDAEGRLTALHGVALLPGPLGEQEVGRSAESMLALFAPTPGREQVRAAMRDGHPIYRQLVEYPCGERTLHYQLSGRPRTGPGGALRGFVGSGHDVTEQVEQRRGLQRLLNALPDAVVEVGPDCRVRRRNPAAQGLLGEGEVPPCLAQRLGVTEAAECPAAGVVRKDLRWPIADASERLLTMTCVPLDDPMRPGHRLLILRDQTETERTRRELAATLAALEQAQAQLVRREKLASIGQLAAGVAHEINNPLGFVNSNLGVLGDYMRATLGQAIAGGRDAQPALRAAGLESADELLQVIGETGEGVRRIIGIVAGLRDQVRAPEPRLEPLQIDQVLACAVARVGARVAERITLRKELTAPPAVPASADELEQIVLHLLRNAIDAIEHTGSVTLRSGHGADEAWFEIEDDGAGIEAETQLRLFDPFFTTKEPGRGTGLGLWVVHTLVERHAGRIDVRSTPGQGTCFRVTLPLTEATGPHAMHRVSSAAVAAPPVPAADAPGQQTRPLMTGQ